MKFRTAAGKTIVPFEISAPLPTAKNFQGVTNDDVIYLIMPDRFANGDTSNDTPKDAPASANGRNNPRAWHGGDFQGVIDKLPYLKELGVTAIWLTPWYDNPNGANECDKPWCPYTNYHGYHAIDYYAVKTVSGRWRNCGKVRAAHAAESRLSRPGGNHVGVQHVGLKARRLKIGLAVFAKFPSIFGLLSPNASELSAIICSRLV